MADNITVFNELPFYVLNHSKSYGKEAIKKVVFEFYAGEAMVEAKNSFWGGCRRGVFGY